MSYNFNKKTTNSFSETISDVKALLKEEGFGVITEIDLKEKFKEKLDVDFRHYTILGACDPASAYEAVQLEDKIGIMLPCNILVQETKDGRVEVAAINPLSSIGSVNNAGLQTIAEKVSERLQSVINKIK